MASPLARRSLLLHGLALGLLALQLALTDRSQILFWGAVALVALAGLKLRESRRPPDLRRAALAELIAVGVLAVMNPELGPSLLQASTALVVLGALLSQEAGGRTSLRQLLGRSLQLAMAALPLLVLLFLLLPRLGPLWSLPGATAGRTGLSDQLDPGAIASLVQDPSPALRVSPLSGAIPPPAQRYWRVLVLDRFDGRRWSSLAAPDLRQPPPPPPAQGTPWQLWVVEPSPVPQLPWSGEGIPLTPGLRMAEAGELIGPGPGGERRRYTLGRPTGPSAWRTRPPLPQDLLLPRGSNPRLEQLAEQWGRTLPPAARVEAAARFFRSGSFRYTLQPGRLPQWAPLDAFLFESRAGFCEHFAGSFTALMRAAGLPARVVLGYQGGEWIGDAGGTSGYLDVRQRDAHAWSEVWLEGQGWVAVDPTGWVAPDRIAAGVQGGLAGQLEDLRRLGRTLPWLRQLEQGWTRLDLAWTRWVLQFDGRSQNGLMDRWLGRWRQWQGAVLVGGLAVALVPAALLLGRQYQGRRRDDLRRELERCLAQLAQLGLQPRGGEDLEAFCARAAEVHPKLREALQTLSASYGQLRYAPPETTERRRALADLQHSRQALTRRTSGD
ncbi:transglutaminaseTgpA domain-containing protein [Vulcanococcus limneticus]|uniref:transglutaminase family protein n=1 Tax=Vulcanococcus limneticus TaxID=2170428 RepID=UPI00398C1B20